MSDTVIGQRTLRQIALEILENWTDRDGKSVVWFGAKPYLQAMLQLETINDVYGYDSAHSIVLYFLSNAQTWRGETARRIKRELKGLCRGN